MRFAGLIIYPLIRELVGCGFFDRSKCIANQITASSAQRSFNAIVTEVAKESLSEL